MQPDSEQITRALQLQFSPGDLVELRAFHSQGTVNGFYIDQDRLAADACQLNSELQAQCYVVCNPVVPELHSRRPDQCGRCGKGDGTADHQVICRRWAVVDCDPIKSDKSGSATDQERQAAEQLARQVYQYLTEQRGLPAPAVATSGNGYWLLLRLADFASDSNSRWALRQFLAHLAEQFDNQAAVVDRSTFSAAQLIKLLGTVARKGPDTADRPHRLSKLLSVPDPLQPVTWQQLVAITGQPPTDTTRQPAAAAASDTPRWDIPQLLQQHGCEYTEDCEYITGSGEQATRYELSVCPFDPAHDDRSAYLLQWHSGAVCFGCHHNGCSGRDWQALKVLWQLPASAGISASDIKTSAPPADTSHVSQTSLESYIDPPVISPAAFYGPIGQIVLGIQRRTEAAPAAVLCCTLAYFGNALGRRYYVQLDQEHYPKLYVALCGATGSGRKGTADVQARRILDAISPTYSLLRHTGLTTGEGLLTVLDENREGMFPRPAIFTEREFAAVLKRAERRGNTLNMFIRDAWDNEELANSTKNNPLRVADHHVSICAHVTPAELKRLLSNTDVANGFCNRFLWVYCRRDERKPGVHGFSAADFPQQIEQLRAAVKALGQRYIDAGHQPQQVPLNPQADQLWRDRLYRQLDIDADEDTLLTLMCSRQAQQVCRLGLIFALADAQLTIQPQHLQAACAIAAYVWESVEYVLSRQWWGDAGNAHDPAGMAPRLLQALQDNGPMIRTDISVQVFQRHRTARELNALRDLLIRSNQIRVEKQGKAETWHLLQ